MAETSAHLPSLGFLLNLHESLAAHDEQRVAGDDEGEGDGDGGKC